MKTIRTEIFEFPIRPMAKQSARFASIKNLPVKKSKTYTRDPLDFKQYIGTGRIPALPKHRKRDFQFKNHDGHSISSSEFRSLIASENPGTRIISYQEKEVKAYQAEIAFLTAGQMQEKTPMSGPLYMFIEFAYEYPKSMSKKIIEADIDDCDPIFKITKPDLDNLTKPVLDALEGIAFVNDSRNCNFNSQKVYKSKNYVKVIIHQLDCRYYKP